MKFRADRPVWSDACVLYARDERFGKVHALTAEVTKAEVDEGDVWPSFVTLPDGSGQSLFQALWDASYRPNNGESSMAHVDALKYHLEDMRKLAKLK
jgi:hypothetical protein